MDFRCNHWIVVTHLGAFDSGQDGFKRVVTISLWDAQRQLKLASADFGRRQPGELEGGVRFKAIHPVLLDKVT